MIYLYTENFADWFRAEQGLPDDTLIDLNDTTTWMYEFIALIVGNPVEQHDINFNDFRSNGIGVLSDAIKAYAEEELNGMFEFYMEYDSNGILVDELKEERIIKAKAQDKLGYQLFRIYSVTKSHDDDAVIVRAQHITYDLANNFVEEMIATNMTKKQVMERIGSKTVRPHPFNLTSSNTTTISSTKLYRTNPLQMVAGMDGSVLQIWGGQIERDNFHLILHDRRGHDDGVTVRYAKNLTGLNAEFDISGLVTRIFPFVYIEETDTEPERLITVSGKYIDSPLINTYSQVYIKEVDYSHDERIEMQDKTDAQIRQQLEQVANEYFEETGNDKVKATLDVNFMHLWETEEYKDVAPLELVGMGDTVTINHSRLKVDATAIVNYIRYDCIAHVNEEVRLGNVKAGLTDRINSINRLEKRVDDLQDDANRAIISANGKSTTYYGPDEPVNGELNDLWFKVVDGVYTRTYRYDGIEWKIIMDMLDDSNAIIDGAAIREATIGTAQIGTIDAAIANIINLSADSFEGHMITSQNDNITFDLNNSEFIIRGGGQFIFQDSGNGIKYVRDGHASGMVLARSSDAETPLVAIGVDTGTGVINANSNDFRGILIQARELDRSQQYIATRHLFAGRADLSTSGIMIRNSSTDGETRSIYGWNSHLYNYDVGTGSSYWNHFYIKGDIRNQGVTTIRDNTGVGGWRVETRADSGSTSIALRGINVNERNYNLGQEGYRINRIYLRNNPDVSSDERIKTGVTEVDLTLAKQMLQLNPRRYKKKLTNADLLSGVIGSNPYEFGFIAQEFEQLLKDNDMDMRFESLVRRGKDNFLSMDYSQMIAIHHRLIQDLYEEIEQLKGVV